MKLKNKTMSFISLNKFKNPTPIQKKVIPAVLKGKGVIGLSKTGTGKTHSYLIPILEKIDSSKNEPYAVITAPTRELAVQIFENAKKMMEVDANLRIQLFVGGTDRSKNLKKLSSKQPHIVIGTPGRIHDLFVRDSGLRLDLADVLVVDEADMTLEYGFLETIDAFAGKMKENLQMLAFSATMPEQLKPFLKKYMKQPITIQIGDDASYNPQIQHYLVPCYHHSFAETIKSILPGFQPYVCLIFANTREMAAEIAQSLRDSNIDVTELHGDLESRQRKRSMKAIMNDMSTYVVATDLAARGIDLSTVTHVISCGFPKELEFYIHRSGRTGRSGSTGICYALYHEEDANAIRSLMKQGISFQHVRCRNGKWQTLQPYGTKHKHKNDAFAIEIEKLNTKKNTKVKPGYKKKRAAKIEEMKRKKRREYIRGKIKEEKKARYKERQIELNQIGKKK